MDPPQSLGPRRHLAGGRRAHRPAGRSRSSPGSFASAVSGKRRGVASCPLERVHRAAAYGVVRVGDGEVRTQLVRAELDDDVVEGATGEHEGAVAGHLAEETAERAVDLQAFDPDEILLAEVAEAKAELALLVDELEMLGPDRLRGLETLDALAQLLELAGDPAEPLLPAALQRRGSLAAGCTTATVARVGTSFGRYWLGPGVFAAPPGARRGRVSRA